MDSPAAPAVGGFDVQLDAAVIASSGGPDLTGGDARLRRTVAPGLSVEADAGVLHVNNNGDSAGRNGYTGRLGVLVHSPDRHWAAGAGVGGGLSPTAGSWGSVDAHVVVSGASRNVRPLLGAGLGYSAPLGHHRFTVTAPCESSPVTLQLPHNTFAGVQAGIELGPPGRAVILGTSILHFWLSESSQVSEPSQVSGHAARGGDDQFFTLGIGLRVALD